MANTCSVCGANIDMVGRSHRCIPRAAPDDVCEPQDRAAVADVPTLSGTYKYRDPEKRRSYMRDLMRKRREKEAAC